MIPKEMAKKKPTATKRGGGKKAAASNKPRARKKVAVEASFTGAEAELDSEPSDKELLDADSDKSLVSRGTSRAVTTAERGLGPRDPMQVYMNEVRRYPLLSREKEQELAVKFAETGDPDAARALVTANLRLVVKLAYEYRRAYQSVLDLVQEGNIGLLQAVKKYDPFRGVKLSSYAAWWIRAYILKFILNNWRLVKIGTTQAQRKLFFNLRKEREKLERMGFEPDHKMLAERLDVSEKDVVEMDRRLKAPDMSLDAPLAGDEDGLRTHMDLLPTDSGARPDVQAETDEFRSLLREKLKVFGADLEGREDVLFRERWLTDSPKTLQVIGDQFGVSRERARQIEKRMMSRLRTYLEAELGSAVDIGPRDD